MGGLDGIKNPLCNLQSWLRLQCNALQKKLYIKSSLWNNQKDSFTLNSTLPVMTSSLFVPPAGHDCSVRLWMLDNRTCVQEITAHRKKHDEAIHDVAFHPSQPFIASAGADALAKIFVWQHCCHSGETELTYYSERRRREMQTCVSLSTLNKSAIIT